ncbi:Rha family transcriptional regulator [Caproicibacterium sp. XB1]|uniref:Rha family transcriptional regulator n=1 Tax=Caproicibacterium sp. XB1 TaxID=3396405 RepID=UPI0039B6EB86
MNTLQIFDRGGRLYTDSREVAKMVGKRHDHLVRDIDGYADILSHSPKLGFDDFFKKSSYKAGTGKAYPCYLITKKGCEFVANKLTGEKGILFTAAYINAFHQMEDTIKQLPAAPTEDWRLIRSEAMKLNAKTKAFKAIMAAAKDKHLSAVAAQVYGIKGMESLTGEQVTELPETGKLYTATEIANALHTTAAKIGKVANANNLKTDEYGIWALDKSRYSGKQVNTFRYNQHGKDKLNELIKEKEDK